MVPSCTSISCPVTSVRALVLSIVTYTCKNDESSFFATPQFESYKLMKSLFICTNISKQNPPPVRDTIEEGTGEGALLTKLQPKDDDDSICQNTQIIQIHTETTPLQWEIFVTLLLFDTATV